ncbi:MAG: hypothetical protein ACPLRY_07020 [Candidatus Bathyarchaeales archaeon]
MKEKERFEWKFERLFRRMEKLVEELAKSHLSVEDKAELWGAFGSFCSGMMAAHERNHVELRGSHKIKRPKAKGM